MIRIFARSRSSYEPDPRSRNLRIFGACLPSPRSRAGNTPVGDWSSEDRPIRERTGRSGRRGIDWHRHVSSFPSRSSSQSSVGVHPRIDPGSNPPRLPVDRSFSWRDLLQSSGSTVPEQSGGDSPHASGQLCRAPPASSDVMALSTSALRAPVLSRSVRSVRGTRSSAGRGNVAVQGTTHVANGDGRTDGRCTEGRERTLHLARTKTSANVSRSIRSRLRHLARRGEDGEGGLDGIQSKRELRGRRGTAGREPLVRRVSHG